jgi:hypothetical protein
MVFRPRRFKTIKAKQFLNKFKILFYKLVKYNINE